MAKQNRDTTSVSQVLLRVTHSLRKSAYKKIKSAYKKNNFLISQPKHMLWVLKRTVSMRRFF